MKVRGGFGRGKHNYLITCYRCGVESHNKAKFSDGQTSGRRGEARIQVT